jgi:hypothetical protein
MSEDSLVCPVGGLTRDWFSEYERVPIFSLAQPLSLILHGQCLANPESDKLFHDIDEDR